MSGRFMGWALSAALAVTVGLPFATESRGDSAVKVKPAEVIA